MKHFVKSRRPARLRFGSYIEKPRFLYRWFTKNLLPPTPSTRVHLAVGNARFASSYSGVGPSHTGPIWRGLENFVRVQNKVQATRRERLEKKKTAPPPPPPPPQPESPATPSRPAKRKDHVPRKGPSCAGVSMAYYNEAMTTQACCGCVHQCKRGQVQRGVKVESRYFRCVFIIRCMHV